MLGVMHDNRPPLVFARYWPAKRPGDLDRGWAVAPRRRRLFWLAPMLGPLPVIAYLAFVGGPLGRLWLGLFVGAVFIAAAIVASAVKAGEDRTGVYEVDEEGRAVRLIAKRLPRELRGDRGVTLAAFRESVDARRGARQHR